MKAGPKRRVAAAGDSLFLVIESVEKGGGKWTLKAARQKWERIRTWSMDTGRDPSDLKMVMTTPPKDPS